MTSESVGYTHDKLVTPEYSLGSAMLASAGAAVDVFMKTAFSTRMLGHSLGLLPRISAPEYRKEWDFYRRPEFISRPELFFQRPLSPSPLIEPVIDMKWLPVDAVCQDLFFDGSFAVLHPTLTSAEIFPETQAKTTARWIKNPKSQGKLLVYIHGYVNDDYERNYQFFELKRFYDLGMDILMYKLPYHGSRKSSKSLFSGDGFIRFDVAHLCENMAWSVYGLQGCLAYVRANGAEKVGVVGFSLGGYHAALMASLDAELSFVISISPFTSMLDLILNWQPSSAFIRATTKALNIDLAEIRQALGVHSPLSREARIDVARLMIIAGLDDKLADPAHSKHLWHHWNKPSFVWYRGNHLFHQQKQNYLVAMVNHAAKWT